LRTALGALYSEIIGSGILRCRGTVIAIAVAAAVVAASFPIVVSLYLARQESLTEQTRRVTLLARDVLRRNDETTTQIVAALDQREAIGSKDPCTEDHTRLMAHGALALEQLHAVSFVANQRRNAPVR
jgi:sensor c-di-GMP phosphodiesterase-like protein